MGVPPISKMKKIIPGHTSMSGLLFSSCCIVVKEHQTAGRLPQEGCQLQSSLRLRLNGRTAHFQNEKIIPGHTSMSGLLFFILLMLYC